jgi:glycosyltransferase involved in cell wall biosynthesis
LTVEYHPDPQIEGRRVIVDVIIPTRDRPQMTTEAVRSVLAQTHQDVNVIVVDDASVRPPLEDLRDERVRIVRNVRSRGPQAARQAGFEHGSASHVALLDSDDIWEPHKLERQLEAIGSADAITSWHAWERTGEPGKSAAVRQTAGPTRPLMTNNMSSPLFTRRSVERSGGFLPPGVPQLPTAEHVEFWVRYTKTSTVAVLPEVLTCCRHHPGERESDGLRLRTAADAYAYILDTHRSHLASFPDDLATMFAMTGARYVGAGAWRDGLAFLARSLSVPGSTNRRALLQRYVPFVVKAVALQK